jgi:hypothetical protein
VDNAKKRPRIAAGHSFDFRQVERPQGRSNEAS